MEEVDNIIITTLKEIGCHLEEGVSGLQGFTADQVVEACVRCLRLIHTEFKSGTQLPEAMSARYRMCTNLANTIQALSYPGEIGYQTFLYSSIKEWRKLLMFLLEKLPRDNAQSSDEPTAGTRVMLRRAIAAELTLRLQSPWTPVFCKQDSTAWSGNSYWLEGASSVHGYHGKDVQAPSGTADLTLKLPKDVKHYYNSHMTYVTAQPRISKDILSSLLEKNALAVATQLEWEAEWNALGLSSRLSEGEYRARKKQKLQKKVADQLRTTMQQGRSTSTSLGLGSDLQTILNSFTDKGSGHQSTGSRFQHAEKLQFAQEDDGPPVEEATEEELQQRREQELTNLQEQLADLTSQLELWELNMKKYNASMGQMAELQSQGAARNKDEEENYKVKKKTFDLLPNADENIAKLKELINKSSDRLALLAGKWEDIRGPLVSRYRTLKADSENKEGEATQLLDEIRLMRERMKELADETRLKDDLYKQLAAEYERMSKDVSRTSYTRRILEIVANIQRQKEDIGKVLSDMRLVQKEINSLTGRLERVFTVTDEQVYKDARKDEARRTAYKLLANIRSNCEGVVEAIKDTGEIMREQRDLEEQIDNENAKKVKANLDRITADFDEMKKENSQLVAKLKAK